MSSKRSSYSDLLKNSNANDNEIDSSLELLKERSNDPKAQFTSNILEKGALLLNDINKEESEGKQYSGRLTPELTKKYNEFMEKIPKNRRRGVHTKLLNLGVDLAIDILNEQIDSKSK